MFPARQTRTEQIVLHAIVWVSAGCLQLVQIVLL